MLDADEAGERPRPAESAIGPMGKLPHNGNINVWSTLLPPKLIGQDLQSPRAPPAPDVESGPGLHTEPPSPTEKRSCGCLRPQADSAATPSRIKKVVDGARPGRLGKGQKVRLFLY